MAQTISDKTRDRRSRYMVLVKKRCSTRSEVIGAILMWTCFLYIATRLALSLGLFATELGCQ